MTTFYKLVKAPSPLMQAIRFVRRLNICHHFKFSVKYKDQLKYLQPLLLFTLKCFWCRDYLIMCALSSAQIWTLWYFTTPSRVNWPSSVKRLRDKNSGSLVRLRRCIWRTAKAVENLEEANPGCAGYDMDIPCYVLNPQDCWMETSKSSTSCQLLMTGSSSIIFKIYYWVACLSRL